jgi:hypothetical protein
MVIDPITPLIKQRSAYYKNNSDNPAYSPQDVIPQYSQMRVTPDYGFMRLGGNGKLSPLMNRGSVELSGFPESNPASLGIPPSLLPRPQMDQINPNINRVVNTQKTTTMIMPSSQLTIPTVVGNFGKGKKHKHKKSGKPIFHGI